jgi:hypothetical protein
MKENNEKLFRTLLMIFYVFVAFIITRYGWELFARTNDYSALVINGIFYLITYLMVKKEYKKIMKIKENK